jgi:hypothetical protein
LAPRQEGDERGLETCADGSCAHVSLLPRPAGRDPQTVRFEGELGAIERDCRDGPSDVRTDAGKLFELGYGRRETTSLLADD